ncbi:hypothetical protein G5714_016953 [Onychostoma macrolepis]|uniref:Uncharacterized protein n=1 Tax=Onychostoma macrolepis TaxID=369639 RepID=A0A7J6C638_9TELE|nr:hypothetical protein G5714_016953 [Onychostoma macrolepis]
MEPESPETHIPAVGAVRSPKRPRQKTEDSIGSAQERQSQVIFASEAHRNTAGEEKACPLQCLDHDPGSSESSSPSMEAGEDDEVPQQNQDLTLLSLWCQREKTIHPAAHWRGQAA